MSASSKIELEHAGTLPFLSDGWRRLQKRFSDSQRPYPEGVGIDNSVMVKYLAFGKRSLMELNVFEMEVLMDKIGKKYRKLRLKSGKVSRSSS